VTVDKKKVLRIIMSMDAEVYGLVGGNEDAMERFREYEKALIRELGLEKELAEVLGVSEDVVRRACSSIRDYSVL
jgi:glucose-6-phosphate-specific signal transduction histidine kinase